MNYCGGGQRTTVVLANSENFSTMGILSSYRVGACKMMPAVPTNTANVNIHKKSRSKTIATYFQSSFTLVESSNIFVCSAINRTQKHDLWISGGQFECEKAGFRITGLFIPVSLSIPGSSSVSGLGTRTGPWI